MPGGRRLGLAIVALFAALIVAVPAARADVSDITFDDQPAGTAIADQYASLGVHFGPSPFTGQSGGVTVVARSQASSAPNAAALAYDSGTDFSSSWIKFDKQQSSVSFQACRTGTSGGTTPNVNAVAYDANGNVVANVSGVTCTANGPMVPVTLTAQHISFVNVYATGGAAAPGDGWAIDDLRFETDPAPQPPPPAPPTPPPPAAPDFSVLRLQGPTAPDLVALAPGASTTAQFVVGRIGSSSGPVTLSVSGLPAGVTASFDDPAPSGSSPALVTLTLTASAAATPGQALLTVTGTPSSTAGSTAHSATLPIVVQGHLAVWMKGIEITQGTQYEGQPDFTTYNGVQLVQGKTAVVRAYVGFLGMAPPGLPPQIGMSLSGTDAAGHPLPGSPLMPDWSPSSIALTVNQLGIGTDERVSPSQAFVFTLPDSWTEQTSISLHAQVLAPADPDPTDRIVSPVATLCLARGCGAVSSRDLDDIPFQTPPPVAQISAIEQDLVVDDAQGNPIRIDRPLPAAATFAKLIEVAPVRFSFLNVAGNASPIPTYRAVRTPPASGIWEDADAFAASIGRPGHSTFGVFNEQSGAGVTYGQVSVGTSDPTATGAVDRPLTVIAHETFHTFGLLHADTTVAKGGCGGDDGAFLDPQGHLGSVGIDISPLSGGGIGRAPYRMIPDTATTPGFDFMSYCATNGGGDPNAWISATNWNLILGKARADAIRSAEQARLPAARRAATDRPVSDTTRAGRLHVQATVTATGTTIDQVNDMPLGADDAAPSAYTLVGLDGAGRQVASAVMGGRDLEVEHDLSDSITALDGTLPAAGVRTVEVILAGAVVASRTASAHAPTVSITTPHTVRGGALNVRWRARDRDGSPLTVELDYSTDGGHTYHDIAAGPADRSARLPVSMLPPSRRARLRLTVNDGFHTVTAASRTFVVAPRPPTATILMPGAGQRFPAGAAVNLSGVAVDAAGQTIPATRLRWYAGRRLLGRGAQLSALLPAGAHRIMLVAADASGRRGSASRSIRVTATTPFFLTLRAPHRVTRHARTVALTVATTEPSTLRIGRQRFAVDRGHRTIRLTIRPGARQLMLLAHLSAGGHAIVQPILIAR